MLHEHYTFILETKQFLNEYTLYIYIIDVYHFNLEIQNNHFEHLL